MVRDCCALWMFLTHACDHAKWWRKDGSVKDFIFFSFSSDHFAVLYLVAQWGWCCSLCISPPFCCERKSLVPPLQPLELTATFIFLFFHFPIFILSCTFCTEALNHRLQHLDVGIACKNCWLNCLRSSIMRIAHAIGFFRGGRRSVVTWISF